MSEVEQDHPAHPVVEEVAPREVESNVVSISQAATLSGPAETINLRYSAEHAAFEPQGEPAELEADDAELSAADESLPDTEDLAPEIEEALENAAGDPNLPVEENVVFGATADRRIARAGRTFYASSVAAYAPAARR